MMRRLAFAGRAAGEGFSFGKGLPEGRLGINGVMECRM